MHWTQADLDAMTEEDLEALRLAILDTVNRRLAVNNLPAQIDSMVRQYLTVSGEEPGGPWRQPTGAHDAYPQDWTVTHAGETWRSLIPNNVWEPGVSGWEIVPVAGEAAPWVHPSGAHDAYAAGAVVTHNGRTWRSRVEANGWEPGVYGWDDITDEASTSASS